MSSTAIANREPATRAPAVSGILETALIVEDVALAVKFYCEIVGLRAMFQVDRLGALDAGPGQTLLLFKRGRTVEQQHSPEGTSPGGIDGVGRSHMAFRIAKDDLQPWLRWLEQNEIAIVGDITWERGGRSIYFRDPDGNLLELATPGLWENY